MNYKERYAQVRQDAKEATDKLINATNCMGADDDVVQGIMDALLRQHRTLQASFFRVLQRVLIEYASAPCDLRNEAAVQFAAKVKKMVEDDQTYCVIPFI